MARSIFDFFFPARANWALACLLACLLASALRLSAAHPTAVALLAPVDLGGGPQATVKWTELSSINSTLAPVSGAGVLAVNAPGFKASSGFYSFGGDYSATASTSAAFGIRSVVLQLVGMTVSGETAEGEEVDYTPEDHLTFNDGPVLTYTYEAGGGTLRSTSHGTLGGPISGSGAGFSGDYHSFAWQWDLSAIPHTITAVSIAAPLRVHSSTIGAQLDVGATHAQVVGTAPLSLLQQWRQTHFGITENIDAAADDADPDHDGAPNLLEYALGRLPKTSDSAAPVTVAINAAGTHLTLTFSRIADPALTYVVEAKHDLGDTTWTDITPTSLATAPAGPVVVEDPQTLAASPKRFLRLRVEAP